MTHFVEEGYENGIGCYWVVKGAPKATDNRYLCKFPYGLEAYKLAEDVASMLNNINHEVIAEKYQKGGMEFFGYRDYIGNEVYINTAKIVKVIPGHNNLSLCLEDGSIHQLVNNWHDGRDDVTNFKERVKGF